MNGIDRIALGVFVSLLTHLAVITCASVVLSNPEALCEKDILERENPSPLEITNVDLSLAEVEDEAAAVNTAQETPPPLKSPEPPRLTPRTMEPPPILVPDESLVFVENRQIEVTTTQFRPDELDAPETPIEEYPKEEKVGSGELRPQDTGESEAVESKAADSSRPAPQQARVVAPSMRKGTLIRPRYPKESRERGEEGDVTMDLTLDAHGVVIGVKIVTSCNFKDLEKAAMAAARKALFRPAKRGDESIPSTVRLTLKFNLRD